MEWPVKPPSNELHLSHLFSYIANHRLECSTLASAQADGPGNAIAASAGDLSFDGAAGETCQQFEA